jgi:uroporphyrinogen-III synthase
MRRLLVLRPEPGASATVSRASERGLEAVAIPLFEVGPLEWHAPDITPFDALLLTSANAVRHGGEELSKVRGVPAYAVGEATAEAAREAGFAVAATGFAGVDRLLRSIEPDLRLLHLCGEDRREPTDARQQIAPVAVYRSTALPGPDLRIAEGAVVLIHSPRAGRRLAELVKDRRSIAIVAISVEAASAAGSGWEAVGVADTPTDDALLALAARLCNKSSPE